MKIKFLLLFSFCCFLWMWSQGVFSQVKVTNGTDLDGGKYVEKIIGEIYPADSNSPCVEKPQDSFEKEKE